MPQEGYFRATLQVVKNALQVLIAAAFALGGCSLGGGDGDGGDRPPRPRGPVVAVVLDSNGERRATLQADGAVEQAAPDGEGGWYVSGQFRNIDGYDRGYLAHVDADGKLDPDWKPRLDRAETTVTVSARMAVGDGRVYLAGDFGSVNGAPRDGGAAVDAQTGELDAAWAPKVGNVSDAILFAGGRVIVATGTFVEAYDAASGQPDPAFRLRTAPDDDNDAGVDTLVASGSQLYIAGFFTRVNGEPRTSVARVDLRTGRVDERWKPPALETRGYGSVYDVAVTAQTVYLIGEFFRLGRERTPEGLTALDTASGARARSFEPPLPGRSADGYGGIYGSVATLGTRLLLGGDFGAAPTRSFVALDLTSGNQVPSWHPRRRGALVEQIVVSGPNALVAGTKLGD